MRPSWLAIVLVGMAACGEERRVPLEIDVLRSGDQVIVSVIDPASPCWCAELHIPRAEGCDGWHDDDFGCNFDQCRPLDCLQVEVQGVTERRPANHDPSTMQWVAGISALVPFDLYLDGCGASSHVTIEPFPEPAPPGVGDAWVTAGSDTVQFVLRDATGADRAAAGCPVQETMSGSVCMDDEGVLGVGCESNIRLRSFVSEQARAIPHGTLRAWGEASSSSLVSFSVPRPVEGGRHRVWSAASIVVTIDGVPASEVSDGVTFDLALPLGTLGFAVDRSGLPERIEYLAGFPDDTIRWTDTSTGAECSGSTPHVQPVGTLALGAPPPQQVTVAVPTVSLACTGGGTMQISLDIDWMIDEVIPRLE